MHQIIYLSLAAFPFTNSQLQSLLTLARRRNTELGITGILLYGNERFLQLLEGDEDAVQELYALIRRDARHGNFITFVDKPATQRVFSEWAMAFKPISQQQFDDIVGYVGPPDTPVNMANMPYTEMQLFDTLRSFVLP